MRSSQLIFIYSGVEVFYCCFVWLYTILILGIMEIHHIDSISDHTNTQELIRDGCIPFNIKDNRNPSIDSSDQTHTEELIRERSRP